MSVKWMSWVWEHGPRDGTDALVLLALADFADDAGRCYPSMRTIAGKARMTVRGAQKVIRRLEADGWVSVSTGNGRHGCNKYYIGRKKGEPCSGFKVETTPNTVLPEHCSPRTGEQKPRTSVHETPNGGSPEPSGTFNNRQQQPREAAPQVDTRQTHLERLLIAMDVEPVSRMNGPNGKILGTAADMAEVAKWTEMGISEADQYHLVSERFAAMRAKNPSFAVTRFAYFTRAMADLAAAKAAPVPTGATKHPSDRDAKLAWYAKIAGQGAA